MQGTFVNETHDCKSKNDHASPTGETQHTKSQGCEHAGRLEECRFVGTNENKIKQAND